MIFFIRLWFADGELDLTTGTFTGQIPMLVDVADFS
jgi:hypothetical protein